MTLLPEQKRRLRRILVAGVLVVIAAVAIWFWSRPQPLAVALANVEPGRVESTVANTRAGTVRACRRAKLAPLGGGQIVRLKVREGDRVKAGQVLLELWNEDAISQLHVAQEQVKTTRLHANEACVLADVAEREAERAKRLSVEGFISSQAADQSISQANSRRAACDAARADTERAQAQVSVAQAALDRTVLRAPFAGVVAEVTGELGEFATPSPPGIPTPPAIDLIDDSCLYVSAPIDEVDAPAIRVGMTGRISLDAFPGRRFDGRVRRIAPYILEVEKQARTVDVEVEFTRPQEIKSLLVGYSADIEIVLAVHENVLRVPTQALLEGNRVLVYGADGKLEERKLAVGLSNWQYTEVLKGVSAGERIVLSLERPGVKAGARVVPEQPNPGQGK